MSEFRLITTEGRTTYRKEEKGDVLKTEYTNRMSKLMVNFRTTFLIMNFMSKNRIVL